MTSAYASQDMVGGNLSYRWLTLPAGEDGAPANHTGTADRTVQCSGTFAGATVLIEGSLDGTNWFTLHDVQGVLLSFTTPTLRTLLESTVFVRPRVVGGAGGTAIDVIINVRR